VPAGATQQTVGGAEDFVKWWFGLSLASIAASDTSIYEEFTSPNCETCDGTAKQVAQAIDSGWKPDYSDNPWVVVLGSAQISSDRVNVPIQAYAPAVDYLDSAGNVAVSSEPFRLTVAIEAAWQDQHWVVAQVREVAE
jgi:hypothetical protein